MAYHLIEWEIGSIWNRIKADSKMSSNVKKTGNNITASHGGLIERQSSQRFIVEV